MTIRMYASNRVEHLGCVYLPNVWSDYPWVGTANTISYMCERPVWYERNDRLYILFHGAIWRSGDFLYRVVDKDPFGPIRKRYVAGSDGYWIHRETGDRLVLESVDYETLYLEETFLT